MPWSFSGRDLGPGCSRGWGAVSAGGAWGVGAPGVSGGGQRKMPIEETGGTGTSSARFPKPSRDRSAMWCWHRGSGCLGEPLHLSRGKPPEIRDLAGAREPSRSTGSTFPAQSPLNHGRRGPGAGGLCQSPACDATSCVTPRSTPHPVGAVRMAVTDRGWSSGQDGTLCPKTFMGRGRQSSVIPKDQGCFLPNRAWLLPPSHGTPGSPWVSSEPSQDGADLVTNPVPAPRAGRTWQQEVAAGGGPWVTPS